MFSPQEIEKIFEMDRLAEEDGRTYGKKRFLYTKLKELLKSKAFIGIGGLRGMGKTILLRQLRTELKHSLYLSADSLASPVDMFELAKTLQSRYGINYVLIDEIHYLPNWGQALKKIYDFLKVKVVFTSSASIDIVRGKYDLSRRVVVVSLPPFSLREFVYFKRGAEAPVISLDDILGNSGPLYKKLYSFEPDFAEFCQAGALPSYLHSPQPQTIQNVIRKVIDQDLRIIAKLDAQDILHIQDILRFIGRSNVEVCSYSSIARNTGITRYKAQEYIRILESASILKVLLPYGTNVTAEPKILCTLPLRPYLAGSVEPERLLGATREEFFIQHICTMNMEVNYLKSALGEKRPDYLIFHNGQKLVFEIGGPGKRGGQLKGIKSERRFVLSQPAGNSGGIPLFLFGFLY